MHNDEDVFSTCNVHFMLNGNVFWYLRVLCLYLHAFVNLMKLQDLPQQEEAEPTVFIKQKIFRFQVPMSHTPRVQIFLQCEKNSDKLLFCVSDVTT